MQLTPRILRIALVLYQPRWWFQVELFLDDTVEF